MHCDKYLSGNNAQKQTGHSGVYVEYPTDRQVIVNLVSMFFELAAELFEKEEGLVVLIKL